MSRTYPSFLIRYHFLALKFSGGVELSAQQPIKISSSACDVTIAMDHGDKYIVRNKLFFYFFTITYNVLVCFNMCNIISILIPTHPLKMLIPCILDLSPRPFWCHCLCLNATIS